MDLIAILRIMLLVFIVIIGILLYVNRNAENQGKVRIAFVLIVVMFVAQFLLFKWEKMLNSFFINLIYPKISNSN